MIMANIRQAQKKDAASICEVSTITWKVTYVNLIDDLYLSSRVVSETSIKKWEDRICETKGLKKFIWVAVCSNKIVGFLWGGAARVHKIKNINFEIYAFYVLPENQRQGIGKKLLLAFERQVKNSFFLWMLEGNKSEIIYQSLGGKKTVSKNTLIIDGKRYQEVAYVWESTKMI